MHFPRGGFEHRKTLRFFRCRRKPFVRLKSLGFPGGALTKVRIAPPICLLVALSRSRRTRRRERREPYGRFVDGLCRRARGSNASVAHDRAQQPVVVDGVQFVADDAAVAAFLPAARTPERSGSRRCPARAKQGLPPGRGRSGRCGGRGIAKRALGQPACGRRRRAPRQPGPTRRVISAWPWWSGKCHGDRFGC